MFLALEQDSDIAVVFPFLYIWRTGSGAQRRTGSARATSLPEIMGSLFGSFGREVVTLLKTVFCVDRDETPEGFPALRHGSRHVEIMFKFRVLNKMYVRRLERTMGTDNHRTMSNRLANYSDYDDDDWMLRSASFVLSL